MQSISPHRQTAGLGEIKFGSVPSVFSHGGGGLHVLFRKSQTVPVSNVQIAECPKSAMLHKHLSDFSNPRIPSRLHPQCTSTPPHKHGASSEHSVK